MAGVTRHSLLKEEAKVPLFEAGPTIGGKPTAKVMQDGTRLCPDFQRGTCKAGGASCAKGTTSARWSQEDACLRFFEARGPCLQCRSPRRGTVATILHHSLLLWLTSCPGRIARLPRLFFIADGGVFQWTGPLARNRISPCLRAKRWFASTSGQQSSSWQPSTAPPKPAHGRSPEPLQAAIPCLDRCGARNIPRGSRAFPYRSRGVSPRIMWHADSSWMRSKGLSIAVGLPQERRMEQSGQCGSMLAVSFILREKRQNLPRLWPSRSQSRSHGGPRGSDMPYCMCHGTLSPLEGIGSRWIPAHSGWGMAPLAIRLGLRPVSPEENLRTPTRAVVDSAQAAFTSVEDITAVGCPWASGPAPLYRATTVALMTGFSGCSTSTPCRGGAGLGASGVEWCWQWRHWLASP